MSANLRVPPEFDHVSKEQRTAFVPELWDRMRHSKRRRQ